MDLGVDLEGSCHQDGHHDEHQDVCQGQGQRRAEQGHRKDQDVEGLLDEEFRDRVDQEDSIFQMLPHLRILGPLLLVLVAILAILVRIEGITLLLFDVSVEADLTGEERGGIFIQVFLGLGHLLQYDFPVDVLFHQ